ncbi:MAG TPA: isoform II [Clostridia bacterium]|nr:isoform II [Clostridia bacterium]
MRLFEIMLLVSSAISIINIIYTGNSRSGGPGARNTGAADLCPENSGTVKSGMNNFWVRNSWASSRPENQKTRSKYRNNPDSDDPGAKIVLPALSAAFAVLSIVFEGYRLFMVPAYLLATILLTYGIIRTILKKAVVRTVGTIFLILMFAISTAAALLFPVIDLPKPTGPYSVGTTLLAFTDTSRKETHTVPGEPRKIPVQIWYPASESAGKERAKWLGNDKMCEIFARCKHVPDILGQLNFIKTNSYLDAGLSSKEDKYPVILFSGGGAMFNGQNAIQMEELASHGYVVCAVGHPYDDFVCIYPDGSVVSYDPEHLSALGADTGKAIKAAKKKYGSVDNDTEFDNNPEFNRDVIRSCRLNNADAILWGEDMSFAADELFKLNSGDSSTAVKSPADIKGMFKGRLDTSNLGIFGHSFGGAAAGEACLHDNRFKAFVNMDGSPFGTAVDNVIRQPFMILTVGKNKRRVIVGGYSKDQKNFMTIYIEGAEHMNFSDFNNILPNIGKLAGILGNINPDRQRAVMNNYILAFFNKHLKGATESIADSVASKYPEVTVEKR